MLRYHPSQLETLTPVSNLTHINGVAIYAETGRTVECLGKPVYQLYHEYPFLEKFYFDFEKNFDMSRLYLRIIHDYHVISISIILCLVYLLLIFAIPKILPRKIEVRKFYIFWNLFLSLFSFIGCIRVVPQLFLIISRFGIYHGLCFDPQISYGHGACGFWLYMFIFSKIPELVDTFQYSFRKRTPIFLHWYHHITVLLFCVHSFVYRSSSGIIFSAMNYFVHAIMYYYYFLASLFPKDKPKWGFFVTTIQTSQMFVGVLVNIYIYYIWSQGMVCYVDFNNFIASIVMYASYAALFVLFALKKYFNIDIWAPALTIKKTNDQIKKDK